MKIIGIDPGLSGALAVLEGDHLIVEDMPIFKAKTRGNDLNILGLVDIFEILGYGVDHAFIELVHSMPQQGVASVFKFGLVYGATKGVIAGCRIPMTEVAPNKWKPEMKLNKDKDRSRARAVELFPNFSHYFARKKDDGRAEAALLAYYGRQKLIQGEI
jgi:crossover junction endodeoxyribonuclease RuvC